MRVKDSLRTAAKQQFWEKNDCLCEREKEKRQKRGKEERKKKTEGQGEKERGGVRGKREERGRKTGNNFSLEERPQIEKLLSNNTGHITEHADTHKIHPLIFLPLYSARCIMRKI